MFGTLLEQKLLTDYLIKTTLQKMTVITTIFSFHKNLSRIQLKSQFLILVQPDQLKEILLSHNQIINLHLSNQLLSNQLYRTQRNQLT